jgi:putative transposase
MTGYNVTVRKGLLPELLSSQDGLAKLVEGILNQILGAQVTESLGAEKHERADERLV